MYTNDELSFIGRRSPQFWVLIYVFQISLFAGIYGFIPGLFAPAHSSGLGLVDAFYFSVVTITTLGYGDIYPDSNPGKIICAFQALSGILNLGLFLNSLAMKIGREFEKAQIALANESQKGVRTLVLVQIHEALDRAIRNLLRHDGLKSEKLYVYHGANSLIVRDFRESRLFIPSKSSTYAQVMCKDSSSIRAHKSDLADAMESMISSIENQLSSYSWIIDPPLLEMLIDLIKETERTLQIFSEIKLDSEESLSDALASIYGASYSVKFKLAEVHGEMVRIADKCEDSDAHHARMNRKLEQALQRTQFVSR